MIHELKTWPEPFAAILDGRKAFEVRKADRPFMVGDTLHLREWNPNGSGYTGRETAAVVTYIVSPGAWGLPPDLCVMGFGSPPPAPETPARCVHCGKETFSPAHCGARHMTPASPASAPSSGTDHDPATKEQS